MIKSFWERIREEKNIENNEKICPYGAYTCQGPQGSINVCIAYIYVCMHLLCMRKMFVNGIECNEDN